MDTTSSFFHRVFALVKRVPIGYVTTYGLIAKAIGTKDSRRVGHALHANKDPDNVPCHRVVFSDGRLTKGYVFGGLDEQRKRLELEGIIFTSPNSVDLSTQLYHFI